MGTWYVVTSQGNVVLGVFGAAILGMAEECRERVTNQTGFPAVVHKHEGPRPSVGFPLRSGS